MFKMFLSLAAFLAICGGVAIIRSFYEADINRREAKAKRGKK